jgi:hypothetical protein
MHDLYEGIVPVELNLLLKYFIKKNYITLEYLNREILSYNYGPLDHTNKPGKILFGPKKQLKIRMKAAKMTCFVRYLPFIIGKKIPYNDPGWKIFTSLSRIIDFSNSASLTFQNTSELETEIVQHFKIIKKEFPSFKFIKKHHNLVHYPDSIRQLGNLVDFNGMRFEGKHTLAKSAATAAHNTLNLPKTISQKFQVNSFFNIYTESILNKEFEIIRNKKMAVRLVTPELKSLIESKYFFSDREEILYDMEIKIYGQSYSKFFYLVVQEKNTLSICWIKDIVLFKDELLFFVQKTLIRNYNFHFCAYFIEHQDSFCLLKKENIFHYKPFNACSQTNNNAIFVKPYSHVNLKTNMF